MSSRLFGRRPAGVVERASDAQVLATAMRGYGSVQAGVYVDEDTAMRHDAVWSCVNRIAQTVAMLPVDVVRYVDGTRRPIEPPPQLIASPSVAASGLDWRYQVLASLLTRGNTWGLVTQTATSGGATLYPTRIELVSAGSVRAQMTGGDLELYVDGKRHDLWPVGDLWHLPAYTMAGSMLGLSPIAYHALTVGKGLAAAKFASDFFAAGGVPISLLLAEGDPGEDGAKRVKESFLRASRDREPVVMPKGLAYQQVSINPEDSQFIETERYSAEQIARIYNLIPPEQIVPGSVTYNNRSERVEDFRTFVMGFWVTKLEQALSALLPRPQVVKVNTDALLRTDPMATAQIAEIRLRNKLATVNEYRRLADESPFDDPQYDLPGVPSSAPATGATA